MATNTARYSTAAITDGCRIRSQVSQRSRGAGGVARSTSSSMAFWRAEALATAVRARFAFRRVSLLFIAENYTLSHGTAATLCCRLRHRQRLHLCEPADFEQTDDRPGQIDLTRTMRKPRGRGVLMMVVVQ